MERSVAVLFPGPSLCRVWNDGMRADYDEVVAVNVACRRYGSDWAVLLDWQGDVVLGGHVEPDMGYVGKPSMRDRVGKEVFVSPAAGLRMRDWEFSAWTMVGPAYASHHAAAWALKRSGGGRVCWFGCDFSEEDDVCGQGKGMRGGRRWLQELPWLMMFCVSGTVIVSDASDAVRNFLTSGKGWEDVVRQYEKGNSYEL